MGLPLAILALAGAVGLHAASTKNLLERMEAISARMDSVHPLEKEKAALDLNAFRSAFEEKGLTGARALALYLAEKKRPLRVRLHAAAFLGSLGEPEAYGVLNRVAKDPEETPGLRSTAVLSLASLRIPVGTRRALFESLLGPEHPDAVRREALGQLAPLGTHAVAPVLAAAKGFGPSPSGRNLLAASHAASALAASSLPEGQAALFDLLRYQKRRSPLRHKIVSALSMRRPPARLSRRDLEAITALLFDSDAALASQTARFLGRIQEERAVEALTRVLKTGETPQLLAEAADALAAIGGVKAGEALLAFRGGLESDARFAGRRDAGRHAARIENAASEFEKKIASAPPRTAGTAAARPFRYEGWPGEGRPVLIWAGRGDMLALKREPRRDSVDGVPLPVKSGGPIHFDASLVIMRRPGLARANGPRKLDARNFGKIERISANEFAAPPPLLPVAVKEGDILEILAYRAEGNCFLRIPPSAEVLEAICPKNTPFFDSLEEPQTDWWLHASAPGDITGWFLSNAPGLEFQSREF